MKRSGSTTKDLNDLIIQIEKTKEANKSKFWKAVVRMLRGSSRQKISVNLYVIEKYLKNDETAVVAGKVLAVGDVTKKMKVAAYAFSEQAKMKITRNGGKAMSIWELLKENPKAKKVRIFG